jgi:predicted CXXCH cytochrome family protein
VRTRLLFILVPLLLAAAGTVLAAWWTPRAFEEDLATPFAERNAPWVASDSCRSCHPDQYASWHRTFHRTMTQEAGRNSVVGVFDGRVLEHWGGKVRPVERDGRYFFEYLDPTSGRVDRTLEVKRTVGSRRYQQYLTQLPGGDTYYRMHYLWHIGEERWVHMNGVFLNPDQQGFDDHWAVWNHNCIFCHNTGPEPNVVNYGELQERARRGEAVDSASELRYSSSVAELGISCESCHGPGGEHAARNRNPFRRYLLHFTEADDPTIVNPEKLDQERQAQICGQCHGQRTPESLDAVTEWITDGPPYRAGEDLDDHVNTIWRDTHPFPGAPEDMFALRFWPDGTARLSAYEYQGLLQSPCYQKGALTCLDCHTMHGGDVRGQLPPENRTNAACLSCHQKLAEDVPAHTHHKPESTGSSCYECHMPRMAYGIMEIHRSHRIENPNPARDVAAGRPDACTNCHLDRSPVWAAEKSREWWGEEYQAPAERLDGADPTLVDAVASLLAGDPVQRAVAARLAGRPEPPLEPAQKIFLVPSLILALGDDYPAVRRFAHNTLRTLHGELAAEGIDLGLGPGLDAFDFIDPPEQRNRVIGVLLERWDALPKDGFPPPPEHALLDGEYRSDRPMIAELRRLAALRSKAISIGE